jgi:hypothetical protein
MRIYVVFRLMFHLLSLLHPYLQCECNRDELLYNYGNEWLISHTGHFTAREGAHSTK